MFKGIREKALVRYSYTADNDDELTLKEGDILTVLDKNLEDAGWWKGELNGSVGVFPDNFVEIIPSEESTVNALSKTHNKIPPQPKPKKPPPPGNNKHTAKPPPELPLEKPKLPPTTDITQKSAKTDRHLPPEPNNLDKPALPKKKEVLPEKPVSMSSKRPVVPPPIGSKPSAKQEARMSASLVETKPFDIPKNFKKEPEAAESLDAVESTDRLTHITASRAKGPSKRPPSNTQTNHNTEDLFQADMKENMSKSIHLLKETNEVPHNVNTPPSRPPEPSPATTKLLTIVEELKKEISDIKANTVSKSVYEDLKQETQRLREELDSLKTKQSKQYRSLFDEIDEEKRIRLNTQVDVERIRKLVSESHV